MRNGGTCWRGVKRRLHGQTAVASTTHALLLNCSSGSHAITDQVSRAFVQAFVQEKTNKVAVREIDLWDENLPRFGRRELHSTYRIQQKIGTLKDYEILQPIHRQAQELIRSDIIVIACPMWNYSMPYVLKQYIDGVVQPGITFKSNQIAGAPPIPMVQDRSIVLVTSAGGKDHDERDFLHPLVRETFSLIGFNDFHLIKVTGSGSYVHGNGREATLAQAMTQAAEMGCLLARMGQGNKNSKEQDYVACKR